MRNTKTIVTAAAAVLLCGGGGAFAMKGAEQTLPTTKPVIEQPATPPAERTDTPGAQTPAEQPAPKPAEQIPADTTNPTDSPDTAPARQEMTDAQVVEKMRGTVVQIHGEDGYSKWTGSGVVINAEQGLILTNAHVASGASTLKATFDGVDGEIALQPFSQAPCDDLAVVKLLTIPAGLQQAPIGDSTALRPMDRVVAIGYPGGLEGETSLNPTAGEVSKLDVQANPDGNVADELPEYDHVIQHTAPIDHGNSGGPLFNAFGEVVGINSLGVNQQGWAITSEYVKALLPDLAAGKSRQWAGWGVWTTAHAVEELADYGFGQPLADGQGMFLKGVEANSPAYTDRFQPGDVILAMNGKPVNTVSQMCDVLRSTPPGGTVPIRVKELVRDATDQPVADPATGAPMYQEGTTKLTLQA